MSTPGKMSDKTADVLFGARPGPQAELGDLVGLVRRITHLMGEVPQSAAMGFAAAGVVPVQVEPVDLPYPTEWTLPMPVWEPGDFSVPAA
jgi:hypothetical protein